MPKVITISDDVYDKLSKLKKGRSFSETINELIEFYNKNKKGNKDVLLQMFGILNEEEATEMANETLNIRKSFRFRAIENGDT
ncbi:antitoxin [Sulfolobus acidocaldarius SUSAZ]|nr:antitoxin [Sulfolobus acidocaldarius SUSAZ]